MKTDHIPVGVIHDDRLSVLLIGDLEISASLLVL
jgi:hypothetical protein